MDELEIGKVIIYASAVLLSALVYSAFMFYFAATHKPTSKSTEEAIVDIKQNENGSYSIYFTKNIKMGSFATYADALKVAKHYNFFNINESE